MNNTNHINRTCPSLGLVDDADTSLGFPSNWNYCHRSNPIAPPRFKHQEEYCLGGKYGECPLFLSQQAVSLPKELRIPRRLSGTAGNNFFRKLLIAIIVFIVVLVVGWGLARQGLLPLGIEKESQTASPSSAPTLTVTSPSTTPAFVIPTMIRPPTFARTQTPNDTITSAVHPTSTPSNHLEVLIGTDYKFVIHKVLEGENLSRIAANYNTNVEAIETVNYFLGNPAWSGTLLVVPVGFTDVAKLPSFVVYQVKEKNRGISVENLAKYLRVTPLDLKYYNGWISDGNRPLVGDYLLVPRPRPIQ